MRLRTLCDWQADGQIDEFTGKYRMAIIDARIQTVEDIYHLIWTAIANKRPIAAIYDGRHRQMCPHRLGRNRAGKLRSLCYQYGGESSSGLEPKGSPANWRCIAVEKLRAVSLLD